MSPPQLWYTKHKVSVGNLKTLRDDPLENKIDVRTELLKFHATYYSANRMTLAILGRGNMLIK